MKTPFLKLLLLVSVLIGSVQAYAGDPRLLLPQQNIIEITAEYYPNEAFYLGYAENPDHTINSIFYNNGEGVKKFFSFQDLSSEVAIIQMTTKDSNGNVKSSYDLVRISVAPGEKTGDYAVTMSYMTNGVFKHRAYMNYTLRYNAHRTLFELLDPETEKLITSAYAKTNYWGSKAVGIDSIVSQ